MIKYVFIQDDPFFLPRVLDRYLGEYSTSTVGVNVQGVQQGRRSKLETARALWRFYGTAYFFWKLAGYARRRLAARVLNDWWGLTTTCYSVEAVARKYGIKVTHESVNSDPFRRMLRGAGVELIVSISGTELYRKPLIEQTPAGIINCHGALLPKYRGLMPSFWMLANGEREGGVSVHFVDEGLDSGPIVVQMAYPIDADETLESLMAKSKVVASEAIIEAVSAIEAGNPTLIENDDAEATSFSMPGPEDARRLRANGHRFF